MLKLLWKNLKMPKSKSLFEMKLMVYSDGVEQYRRMPMTLWKDFKEIILAAPLIADEIEVVGPRNELLWLYEGNQESMHSYLRGALDSHERDFSCITVELRKGKCNEVDMLKRFRRQKRVKKFAGDRPFQPTSIRDRNQVVFSSVRDRKRRVTISRLRIIRTMWNHKTIPRDELLEKALKIINKKDSGISLKATALTGLLSNTIGFYNAR